MSKNSNVVENGAIAPVEIEPIEPVEFNGNTEIMPVNDRYYQQSDLQEVTPLQAAAVLGGTMVIGYGIGKLGEFMFDKWIGPACKELGKKWDKRKANKNRRKSEDRLEEVDPNEVEVTVTNPNADYDDDEEAADQENEDRYEKATRKILETENKKKNKRK